MSEKETENIIAGILFITAMVCSAAIIICTAPATPQPELTPIATLTPTQTPDPTPTPLGKLEIAYNTLSAHNIIWIDMSGRGSNDFNTGGVFDKANLISFPSIDNLVNWCELQNVTTVIHYYGNMRSGIFNYDYFFYIDGDTIYRYVIE